MHDVIHFMWVFFFFLPAINTYTKLDILLAFLIPLQTSQTNRPPLPFPVTPPKTFKRSVSKCVYVCLRVLVAYLSICVWVQPNWTNIWSQVLHDPGDSNQQTQTSSETSSHRSPYCQAQASIRNRRALCNSQCDQVFPQETNNRPSATAPLLLLVPNVSTTCCSASANRRRVQRKYGC